MYTYSLKGVLCSQTLQTRTKVSYKLSDCVERKE